MYLSTLLAQEKQEVVSPSSSKNNLDCRVREINKMSSESFEFVPIKLQAFRCKNMNIIAVYRPPYHNNLT